MQTTRESEEATQLRSWVVSTMVVPCRLSSRRRSRISCSVRRSTPLVGSSSMTRLVSEIMARASSSRCCCAGERTYRAALVALETQPFEQGVGLGSFRPREPGHVSADAGESLEDGIVGAEREVGLDAGELGDESDVTGGMTRAHRSAVEPHRAGVDVGRAGQCPARSIVDLPDPLGPTIPMKSPGSTAKSTASMAGRPR